MLGAYSADIAPNEGRDVNGAMLRTYSVNIAPNEGRDVKGVMVSV